MIKVFNFKPKLLPTIFTIPALILLFGLSFWQFERLSWKQDLIKEVTEQSKLASVDIPSYVELKGMLYRKVKLKGEFIHNQEIHMYGGSREFKGENGYYIFTPMHLEDGRIIVINRGWVPEKKKLAINRPETIVKGIVEIEGAIMQSEKKPLYVHDNQPDRNLWFYANLDEMKGFLKDQIEGFYILAKDVPKASPRGRNLDLQLRNHHLGYALTWLFSGIGLMVIYIMYHRKK